MLLCEYENSGYQSDLFWKTRGVNQGCPTSPVIFTQTCAVIEQLIAENSNIRGIRMNNLEYLLTQFANDTGAFLQYDPLTLEGFCEVLGTMEEQIGLKVSYDKTSLYRVGSLAGSQAKCYTTREMKWTNEDIQILGLILPCDGLSSDVNYQKILDKVDRVLMPWAARSTTLMGKVLIVNSLVGSLFVYNMMTMCDLNREQLNKINKNIHHFLWGGKKRGRISMYTLQRGRDQGGLRLVDLKSKQEALKIQGIFRMEESVMRCLYSYLNVECLHGNVWQCNLNVQDCDRMFLQGYWKDVIRAWCRINFYWPQSKSQVMDQVIWLNSGIKINGIPILWRKWIQKGYIFIRDLVREDGSFLEWKDLPPGLLWIDWLSLKADIPVVWKLFLADLDWGESRENMYNSMSKCAKKTHKAYDILIDNSSNTMKYAQYWIDAGLSDLEPLQYLGCFKDLYRLTKITK